MPDFPPTSPTIEHELGVSFPGPIVPLEFRAKTRIQKLRVGPWSWRTLFGRDGPLILDVGCGSGRFTLSSAILRPECNHLGLDDARAINRASSRADDRGLWNVRFAATRGNDLLRAHVVPGSVAEIHCYHPPPCYRESQVQRRLITPGFLALTHRALTPNGLLVLQTDSVPYWNYMLQIVPLFFDFEQHHGNWPDAPMGRTTREQVALRAGISVFRGIARVKTGLIDAEALEMAEEVPPPRPVFDQELFELDALTRNLL